MPPTSWPTRLLAAFPPMPDGLWLGFLLLIVFMLGITVGQMWCMGTATPAGGRPTIQQQLDAMDKRLKALESR